MNYHFQRILGKHMPLQMPTDAESLFDSITKCSTTTEKRLVIEVQVVRVTY